MARHERADFNSIDCCFGHQQTHTHTPASAALCLRYRMDWLNSHFLNIKNAPTHQMSSFSFLFLIFFSFCYSSSVVGEIIFSTRSKRCISVLHFTDRTNPAKQNWPLISRLFFFWHCYFIYIFKERDISSKPFELFVGTL